MVEGIGPVYTSTLIESSTRSHSREDNPEDKNEQENQTSIDNTGTILDLYA